MYHNHYFCRAACILALVVLSPIAPSTRIDADGRWPLFIEAQTFGCGNVYAVTSGDFNSDGRTDVAVVSETSLCVFLQDAETGRLHSPVETVLPYAYPPRKRIASGDFNHDGRDDVVVTDGANATVQVWAQTAGGTLEATTPVATVPAVASAVADLNSDGRDDVAVTVNDQLGVHLQLASGGLGPLTAYTTDASGFEDIEAGDVNGDGWIDLVTTSSVDGRCVVVHPGAGGGALGSPVVYACDRGATSIGVGDATGDGRTDVVSSAQGNKPTSIYVFAQSPAGSLAPPVEYVAYDLPLSVVVRDVTMDARQDVVVLHNAWMAASVYRQRSDGTLTPYELYEVPYSYYTSQSLNVADINSDGFPDLLVGGVNYGLSVLYHSTGDLTLSTAKPPDIIFPGQMMSLTLRVENHGPLLTRNVTLTDTLPTGAGLVAVTPSQGTCSGNLEITCQFGNLDAGAAVQVTIAAHAPPSPGIAVNTAVVQTFGDVILNNNVSEVRMRIGWPNYNYLPLIWK